MNPEPEEQEVEVGLPPSFRTGPTFETVYKACEEFGFDKQITAEMCWNEGYQLGRKRWHWGPHWMVASHGWINTQISKLWKRHE